MLHMHAPAKTWLNVAIFQGGAHFIKECQKLEQNYPKSNRQGSQRRQRDIGHFHTSHGIGARLTLKFSPLGWCEHKRAGLAHGSQSVHESA